MKVRICVPVGCRSDEGLSAPVIRRLKESDWCEVTTLHLIPQDFGASYQTMHDTLYWKPQDMVLITGDRVEMCAAAAAAFHLKTKIAHLYAGVVNDPITTFDDVDRHVISQWADTCLCENDETAAIIHDMKQRIGLRPAVAVVGITHLDDIEIDESKVPDNPYDLVLINKPSLINDEMQFDAGNCIVQVGENPDGIMEKLKCSYLYGNLPRPQFLGLLKNCRKFITNSSAAIYEAPYFLEPDQIVMVGERNRNRAKVECKPGGSDRVVQVLKEYFDHEKEN